jgi:hypothetical protein
MGIWQRVAHGLPKAFHALPFYALWTATPEMAIHSLNVFINSLYFSFSWFCFRARFCPLLGGRSDISKVSSKSSCQVTAISGVAARRAGCRPQGGQPAAVFYSHGYPTPYSSVKVTVGYGFTWLPKILDGLYMIVNGLSRCLKGWFFLLPLLGIGPLSFVPLSFFTFPLL